MRAPAARSGAVTSTTWTGSVPAISPGPRGSCPQLLVLREREAVGHPRDVVRDRASFALLPESRHHVRRQRVAPGAVMAIEVAERLLGAAGGFEHALVVVQMVVKELLELTLQRRDFTRESHQRI